MQVSTENNQMDLRAIERVACRVRPDRHLVWGQDHSVAAEKYRLLAHRVQRKRQQKPVQAVLVTSAVPKEGKTSVATNLATVLARNGHRVLLIDADLREPDVNKIFELPSSAGLSEVLSAEIGLERALRCLDPVGLYCLPAGRPLGNPIPLLEGAALKNLLATVRETFEWVVVDSPPLNPFADSQCIASASDGVLLVVRWGYTPKEELDQALSTLSGLPLIGLVVNGCDEPRHENYYYSYYGRSWSEPGRLALPPVPRSEE